MKGPVNLYLALGLFLRVLREKHQCRTALGQNLAPSPDLRGVVRAPCFPLWTARSATPLDCGRPGAEVGEIHVASSAALINSGAETV